MHPPLLHHPSTLPNTGDVQLPKYYYKKTQRCNIVLLILNREIYKAKFKRPSSGARRVQLLAPSKPQTGFPTEELCNKSVLVET
jgi:hypothetical protein